MPSTATITAFYSFSAGAVISSSQVNNNFSNFRGHFLPTNTDTATASNRSHDLGASDHAWRKFYNQYCHFYANDTVTAADNPPAGYMSFYFKSDGSAYIRNSSGTETDITGGQVASATQSGVVSTASTQSFGGEKKFEGGIAGIIQTSSETGTAITLGTPTFIKRLGSTITSIAQITAPSTSNERIIVLTNASGSNITVLNSATATTAAILTGNGSDLVFANTASIILYYDTTSTRWRIVGGSGSSAPTIFGSRASPRSIVPSTGIVAASSHMSTTDINQTIYIESSVAAAETEVSASPPIQAGTVVGQRITLIARSSTAVLKFLASSSGVDLKGDWLSYAGTCLVIEWDGTNWYEITRRD